MRSHLASSRCTTLAILVCCALRGTSLFAASFAFPDFSSTSGLNLVTSAVQTGSEIRLNPAAVGTTGAMWHTTKQPVDAGFETMFQFRVTGMSGEADPSTLAGGDGLAVVGQNTSTAGLGANHFLLGFEIAHNLAVEFHTLQNSNFLALEPSNNHVGVQSLGTAVNSPFAAAFLGAANVVPNMSDTNVHTAMIRYVPGSIQVFVDDMVTPVLSVAVNLGTLLNLDSGTAYVGLTGGGANAYENHFVLNWKFRSIPEPASIFSLILGSLGLCSLARGKRCSQRRTFARHRAAATLQ